MIFLKIKAVPQCLPIHSQSCTMRQLNLDVERVLRRNNNKGT
jgi:hypothetical protein